MVLGAAAAGVVVVVAAIRRFRRALLAELAVGYVTTTFHQGLFWFVHRPGPVVGNDVVGWVWAGVWVLDSSGNVVSAQRMDPPFHGAPSNGGCGSTMPSQLRGHANRGSRSTQSRTDVAPVAGSRGTCPLT